MRRSSLRSAAPGSPRRSAPLNGPGRSLTLRAKGRIAYPPASLATFLDPVSETARSSRPALLIEWCLACKLRMESRINEASVKPGDRHLREPHDPLPASAEIGKAPELLQVVRFDASRMHRNPDLDRPTRGPRRTHGLEDL